MKKKFIKSLAYACLVLCLPAYNLGQEKQDKYEAPATKKSNEHDFVIQDDEDAQLDIPLNYTSLVVDWGITSFTSFQDLPRDMDLSFWGSRVLGGAIYYNIPIAKSHFMASFGVGLSNADYTFKSERTLDRDAQTTDSKRGTKIKPASQVVTGKNTEIQKSKFSMNYVDLIGEIRINFNKEEPREGFFIAIGGNIGYQFSPSTSIYYKQDDENKIQITKESFNIRKYRWGVLARIGWNRFGIVYNQTLSGLFNDKGPTQNDILPFSVGISINLL
jgi:hypothetical protein